MFQRSLFLAVLCFPVACGTSAKKAAEIPSVANILIVDSQNATAVVASQLDESASALNAGDASSNGAAAFANTGAITASRTCTADATAKTANVAITYSGNSTATVGKWTVTANASGTETRVWSNPVSNAAVGCTTDGLYAKIGWNKVANVSGLKLVDTTKRLRAASATAANKKGVTQTRNQSWSEDGTRTVTWSVPTGATDTTTTSKTIIASVNKTYSLTKVDGTTQDLSAGCGGHLMS